MDKKRVGKQIQHYREKAGLSQEALAEMVGLSSTSISKIERGITFPTMTHFVHIINAIGASADEILDDVALKSYKSRGAYLSDKLEELPAHEREEILRVVKVLIEDKHERYIEAGLSVREDRQ